MRNLKNLLFIVSAMLMLTRCKKEITKTPNEAKPTFSEIPENLMSHFCYAYLTNTQDSNTLFTYDLNFEQQNYYAAKYQLALAVRNLATNPTFINNLHYVANDWYQRTSFKSLPIYTLIKEDSVTALQLANELSNVLGNGCSGFNCFAGLESTMDVNGYKYELAISIYNIEESSNMYIPIVSPTIDVDPELYPNDIQDDAVLSWAFNPSTEVWDEIVIDESMSVNCETMVIGIVSVNPGFHYVSQGLMPPPHFYNGIKLPPPIGIELNDKCADCPQPPATAGDKFSTYDFKIKVRHERYGDSQVWNFGSRIAQNNQTGVWSHIPYPFAFSVFKKVNKNDINKWLYLWNEVADRPVTLQQRIDQCNTCWNSVERDWFEGPKIHCGTYMILNGVKTPIFSYSNRSWMHDVFAYNAEDTPKEWLAYDWVCLHPSQWANNWIYGAYGDFKMIRVQ